MPPAVQHPEKTETEYNKDQRCAGGNVHLVGSHQAIDLHRQGGPLRVGEQGDHSQITHREGGAQPCGKPQRAAQAGKDEIGKVGKLAGGDGDKKEMLKKFDKNGDGKLDDEERKTAAQAM